MKKILLLLIFSKQFFSIAQPIGIGTQNPRAKLEVHGSVGLTSAIFGGESSGISVQSSTPTIGFNQYGTANGSKYIGNGYAAIQYVSQFDGSMGIDLYPHGLANNVCPPHRRVLTLSQNGVVTIGSSIANSALVVARNPGVDATAYLFGTTNHSIFNLGAAENTHIRPGRSSGSVFINDIPGSKIVMNSPVGINTATPFNGLEIRQKNGYGMALVEPTNFNYWEFVVSGFNGNQHLRWNNLPRGQFSASNGSYSSVSDKRLKTAIQPLPSVLANVMQLQPVEYEMIYNNPQHQKTIGFIAQDVKTIFPELVTVSSSVNDSIPNLHSLSYSGIGVLAVKAVQEQQAVINATGQGIDALEEKLNALHKKIAALCKK